MHWRHIRLIVAGAIAAIGSVVALLIFWPYAGFRQPVTVVLPRGTTSYQIARELAAHHVIRSRWLFLIVRLFRPRDVLKAGEYRFERPASVVEVFDRIARGDVVIHELRIPEGSTMFEIASLVAQLGWIRREEFLAVALDPTPIRDLAPQARSLEGYLFPSTYYVTRDMDARAISNMMLKQFRKVWAELDAPYDRVHEIVTVASIVEEETAVPEERPLVASVVWNRLRRGMRLECDPTAIYAAILSGEYQGHLTRADLERPHPYNTYYVAGLPPGPIANPGRASLLAALHPAQTDYLFFVARPDGSGAHKFSSNFDAHNRAVRRYRLAARQNHHQAKAPTVPGRTRRSSY